MEAKSVITFPSGEMNLPGPGFYEITGLAWSGRGKIARVEISTDVPPCRSRPSGWRSRLDETIMPTFPGYSRSL